MHHLITQRREPQLLYLNFHGLGKCKRTLLPGEEDVWLPPETFQILVREAVRFPYAVFTFDDGNDSDIEYALPCLQAHNIKATFFLSAGLLNRPGYLSISQVHDLLRAGMYIGNHGMLHRDWRHANDTQLEEELVSSKQRLEDLFGTPVYEAACPFGHYDRRVLKNIKIAGYKRVYTSDTGWAKAHSWLRPRNTLRRTDDASSLRRLFASSPTSAHSWLLSLKRLAKRLR